MPMYDFLCNKCKTRFEDLIFTDEELPCCPRCGSKDTNRLLSLPSPLKTGAFPFKVGPVNQSFVNRVRQAESGIAPSCTGTCGQCPHSGTGNA